MGLPVKKDKDKNDKPASKEQVDGAIKAFGEKKEKISPKSRKKVADKLKELKNKAK